MRKKPVVLKLWLFSIILLMALSACTTPSNQAVLEPVVETSDVSQQDPQEPAVDLQEPVAVETRLFQVADVQVQIGVGSPIPVEVVASGTWPDLCAQLSEMTLQFNANRFEISLSASPADPVCPPDPVGIPFRIAVPLNMVEKPYGTYSVVVNGFETSFEWAEISAEPIPVENFGLTLAYIGTDGNLWIADASGGPPRQLTTDATLQDAGGEVVSYYFPKISSDGRYIAVRRDAGVPVSEGMQYQFGLWVYDAWEGGNRAVFEDVDKPPAGFDWKPGSHLLASGFSSDPSYFTGRGVVNSDLATGINSYDMDTGENNILVQPENGYTLLLPSWSPDGRILSFDELLYMEGRGNFAYYDFENQQYSSWEEALGNYDWSPDGSALVYDRLTYAPNGEERIYTRPRLNGSEQQLSPDSDQGYSFYPVYAPEGSQVAYVINQGGPESVLNTLVLQNLSNGVRMELGVYESAWDLQWSSDGRMLVFSAGPYETREVYAINIQSGETRMLVQGSQPSLATP